MGENLSNITKLVGDLDEETILKIIDEFTKTNPKKEDAQEMLQACCNGLDIVGDYFEKGIYFLGDLIFAGDLLKNIIEQLKPYLGDSELKKIGTIVVGSAPGDLHNIGKNIFIIMAEAAGFLVHDIGVDIKPAKFVSSVKEFNPDIVGISGLLTQSLETMKDVVDAFKEAGIRDKVKIIIGGNPTNDRVKNYAGADGFANNAPAGIKQCKEWMV